jgi:hypothetical protein
MYFHHQRSAGQKNKLILQKGQMKEKKQYTRDKSERYHSFEVNSASHFKKHESLSWI